MEYVLGGKSKIDLVVCQDQIGGLGLAANSGTRGFEQQSRSGYSQGLA
jgi:hypothetical protein